MREILVSIIIPCFNVEGYIGRCLDSVLVQTYRPIEIIVVDNNSLDRTSQILKKYKSRHPDLITVTHEQKQGAPIARNKGLLFAKGEWIQFLDADCVLLPNKIKHQVELLKNERTPKIMVVSASKGQTISGEVKILPLWKNEDPYKAVLFYYLGNTIANLFLKSALDTIKGWDESLIGAQDPDLIFRMLCLKGKKRIVYDKTIQSVSFQRPYGQISTTSPQHFHACALEVRIKMCKHLEGGNPDYYKANISYFQDAIFYFIAALAMHDLNLAEKYYFDILGKKYFPNYRKGIISLQQSIGVKILGFRFYFKYRKIARKIFKSIFPNFAVTEFIDKLANAKRL